MPACLDWRVKAFNLLLCKIGFVAVPLLGAQKYTLFFTCYGCFVFRYFFYLFFQRFICAAIKILGKTTYDAIIRFYLMKSNDRRVMQ